METVLQSYMDYSYLLEQVRDYESPKAKIATMIKSGTNIRVKSGLYLSGQPNSYSLKTLADRLYWPSNISSEYALACHILIPEGATTITPASLAACRVIRVSPQLSFSSSSGQRSHSQFPSNYP